MYSIGTALHINLNRTFRIIHEFFHWVLHNIQLSTLSKTKLVNQVGLVFGRGDET